MLLERHISLVLSRPRLVVAFSVVWVIALALGIPRLDVTSDMRAYFSADNPQLAAFNRMEATFERQDNLLLVVVANDGDLFTRDRLTLLVELTALGWQVPYSRRVDSLANHQWTRGDGDTLVVEPLLGDGARPDAERAKRTREVALSEPTLLGRVVSRDGVATGVNIALELPAHERDANDEVIDWIEARLPAIRARYPDVRIEVGGTTATNVALGQAVRNDIVQLVSISFVVIMLGLVLALRHVGGSMATIAVVCLSVLATMGLFGWLDTTLAAVAGFVPSVVMTIAVADSVHILSSFYYELRRGRERRAAIEEAMRINARPVLVTTVTTAIGVLTLNFSDSPPYRDLGNMVAVGVVIAYLLSMTFLPALITLLPTRRPDRGKRIEAGMNRFAGVVIDHRKVLLPVVAGTVLLLAAFITRNELTERWHEYFDDTFEVRRAIDAVSAHLGGLHVLRYALDGGSEHAVNEPEYLATLERFARWLRTQPGVTHVTSIADVIKRLNRDLHTDPQRYRIPETRELTAQYLLLYELSLPFGLGLEHVMDVGRATTTVTVLVARTDSERLIALDRRATDWLERNAPAIATGPAASVDMMFAHINHRNIRGLLWGMATALVLISMLLLVVLRSWKLGALSLVTNLAPAGLAYGLWGMTAARIDLSASVVMCMSIGVVVDDTVHFLSKYLHARRAWGEDAAGALRYAFNTVGVALLMTTAVLVAGFSVLGFSHFAPTVTTGILLAITLSFALVVDFLLMPPLLMVLDR